jgi:hypothetical protein
MGCGGTKTDMNKKELVEWVKKERTKFEEDFSKEEKQENEKMYQTLQKGFQNGSDPLAEGLKAIGEMQKNIELHVSQKNYLDYFGEIEQSLNKSEYTNITNAQEIFAEFLKVKEKRDFANANIVMEKFRKYIKENDKNPTISNNVASSSNFAQSQNIAPIENNQNNEQKIDQASPINNHVNNPVVNNNDMVKVN